MLVRIGGSVCFSERMPTGNQGDSLFVVHGHPTEGVANRFRGCQGIGFTRGALWVDVNQSHLSCPERTLKFTFVVISFASQPLRFRSPVHIFLRLPDIFSS